jgi:hypothetical protein
MQTLFLPQSFVETHETPMNWYAICNKDGLYWARDNYQRTSESREYTASLEFAKLFTEEEKELSFCFFDEFWYLLPNNGDA